MGIHNAVEMNNFGISYDGHIIFVLQDVTKTFEAMFYFWDAK